MIERDSISTEKQDLNQHSDSEDVQRKKLANQGSTDRKDAKAEDIQNENVINQGSTDRKDAKAEDIQNENVINQSGADEEDIDKNGVYHGPIVDVHAYKGNTVGGAMSSREAIEYTDNSGRVHRGFFTPEKKETSFETDWMAVKKEFMDEFPEYRDIIDKITTNRKMWKALIIAGKDDFKTGEYKNVETVLKTYKDLPENPVFRRMMGALFEEAYRLRNLHALYKKNGIKEGDIIAKRASAMTDVAMELGYPDLLANSYRLTLSRNGEKIPGVFIETADLDAVDKRNWTIDEPIFDMPESEFDNPRFLKSLADLQILDYLCGNIDRHSGNFFVRQDISNPKKPQLIGVQGIDNDLSFGVVIGGVQQLAKEYNLLVISSEMAEAILKLEESKLMEIMKKNGITDANQLDLAVDRLHKLESRINQYKQDVEKRKESFAKKIKTTSLKPGKTEEDYLYEPRLKKREFTLENEFVMDKKSGQYVPLKIEDVRLSESSNGILIVENDKYWKMLKLDMLVPDRYTCDEETKKWKRIVKPETNMFDMAQVVREKVKIAKKKAEEQKARAKKNPKKQKTSNSPTIRYIKHTMIIDFEQVRKLMQEEYRQYLEIQKEFKDAGGENPERSKYFKRMKGAYEDIIEGYRNIEPVFKKAETQPGYVIGELKKFYNELSVKRATALSKTKKYLSNANWRWWKKTDDYQERIEIAEKLKEQIENIENIASQELFQNQISLKERTQDKMVEKGAEFSDFMKEQMFALMRDTLYENITALPHNDTNRQNAINALRAQKRLWEYASTQWKEGNNQKQGDSAEKAMYDVDIILKYAPELKEEMEKQEVPVTSGEGKGLSPAQALRALNVLYQKEYNIAKERRKMELEEEEAQKKNASEKENSHAEVQKGKELGKKYSHAEVQKGKEYSHADMKHNKMTKAAEKRFAGSEAIQPQKGRGMIH